MSYCCRKEKEKEKKKLYILKMSADIIGSKTMKKHLQIQGDFPVILSIGDFREDDP